MKNWVRSLIVWGILVFSGFLAEAAVFTVSNDLDAGAGSLRQAILDANAAGPGPHTINFTIATLPATITLASTLPVPTQDIIINGPGARLLTVSGNSAVRVFEFTNSVNVTIKDLTIVNGFHGSTGGGGISVLNTTLILERVEIKNCSATVTGGAIYATGNASLDIQYCTIADNTSSAGTAGIAFDGNATGSILGSTFYQNSGAGGAIKFGSTSSLSVKECTFANNVSSSFGGGIYNPTSNVEINRCVFSGNSAPTGPDLSGTFVTNSANYISNIGGATCSPVTPTTGPAITFVGFGYYGGHTRVLMPPINPLLMNQGATGSLIDQRGFKRPMGASCDLGAVEIDSRLEILSITSNFQPATAPITINGNNFDPVFSNNEVFFGPVKATITSATTTTLDVIVPYGASSTTPITIVRKNDNVSTGSTTAGGTDKLFYKTFAGGALNANTYGQKSEVIGYVINDIATGDFDGDGWPDMVSVSTANNTAYVSYRNTATGGFESPLSYGTPSPEKVVVGDFNGDGRLDFATIRSTNLDVFLRNPGNTDFLLPQSYTTSVNTNYVTTGDYNNDGKADIIIGHVSGVDLLAGNADNTGFNLTTMIFSPTGSCRGVQVGDFNNDGLNDLATVTTTDFRIFPRLANNSGYGPQVVITGTSALVKGLTMADYNKDGWLDLATADEATDQIKIILNDQTAAPSVGFGSVATVGVGNNPSCLTSGDFDGDGNADIAFGNSDAADLYVGILRGDGSGGFLPQIKYAIADAPTSIITADFNVDGKADIATNFINNDGFNVLYYGAPLVTALAPPANATAVNPSDDVVVTLDQNIALTNYVDGIAIHGSSSGKLSTVTSVAGNVLTADPSLPFFANERIQVSLIPPYLESNKFVPIPHPYVYEFRVKSAVAPGTFVLSAAPPITADQPRELLTGDFNNDGKLDVLIEQFGAGNVILAQGDGLGGFSGTVSFTIGANMKEMVSGDFDGNGCLDFAVAVASANQIQVVLNPGCSPSAPATYTCSGTFPEGLTSGDLDGDGDLDLAVSLYSAGMVELFANDGSGVFVSADTIAAGGSLSDITCADIDGDYDLDLAIVDVATTNYRLLINNGALSFILSPSWLSTGTSAPKEILALNIDGDADMDLTVLHNDRITLMKNNGLGSFTVASSVLTGGTGAESIVSGDWEGDGDWDLAAVNSSSNQAVTFFNDGSGNFSVGSSYAFAGSVGYSVAAGDFDNDGDIDLVTGRDAGTAGRVEIRLNRQAIKYVKWNATGANNGSSWANAYTDLQSALAAAVPGDTIWVAGTAAISYKPDGASPGNRNLSFPIKEGVAVYGGFNGTETALNQRDWVANPTILSGDLLGNDVGFTNNTENSYHVLTAVGILTNAAVWDGFVIRGGNANGGGIDMYGGALVTGTNQSPRLANCTFTHNNAGFAGGAIALTPSASGATLLLVNCKFINNNAVYGGGLSAGQFSAANIFNTRFVQNTATTGSAIYAGNSNVNLVNALINGNTDNSATDGGAFYLQNGATAAIKNCTFTHNNSTADAAGGALKTKATAGLVVVENSIFWNNVALAVPTQISAAGTITVSHSLVEGGYAGAGNISCDPLFLDADGADNIAGNADDSLSPGVGSPAFDNGNSGLLPQDVADLDNDGNILEAIPFDLHKNVRNQFGNVDMGAFERNVSTGAIDSVGTGGTTFCSGDNVTVTITTTGSFNAGNTFSAQLSDATGSFAVPVNLTGSLVSTTGGSFTANIPLPTVTGIGYRIRVVATNPAVTSACDNGTNITINTTPPAPTANNNGPLCAGQTLNLTTPFVPGAIYNWSGPGGFSSTAQNPVIPAVSGLNAGTYSVTITTLAGCTSPAGTTNVVINPVPATPVAGSNSPLCNGQTLNLTASTVAGASYYWTGPGGYVSTLQNPTIVAVTPANIGTYNVVAIVAGCTSAVGSTNVVINPVPAGSTAGSNSPVCAQGNIHLTATTVSGASYYWTGPSGFTSTLQNPTIVNALAANAGVYNVVAIVAGCTSAVSSTAVVVNPNPDSTMIVNPAAAVCVGNGGSVTLSSSEAGKLYQLRTGLSGGTNVGTTVSGTGAGITIPVPAANLATVGLNVFNVKVNDPITGCFAEIDDTVGIVVNALPTVTVPADTTVCINSATFTLTGQSPLGGSWSGTGVSGSSFNPTGAGIGIHPVQYSYTDILGCTNTAVRNVTVRALPIVSAGPAAQGCVNGSVLPLAGTPAGGSWSGTGVSGSTFNPALTGVGSFTIYYLYTDVFGCTDSAAKVITVYARPVVSTGVLPPTICKDAAPVSFSPSPSGGSWSGSPAITPFGLFTPALSDTGLITLKYAYTDGNGCTDTATGVILVLPEVVISAGADTSVCINSNPLLLAGLPPGGNWSGTGVSANVFNPASVGIGSYTLNYLYVNPNGCVGNAARKVTVTAPPVVYAGADRNICINQGIVRLAGLPAGGNWSSLTAPRSVISAVGDFDPAAAGLGNYDLVYEYTDATGCVGQDTVQVRVTPALVPAAILGSSVACAASASEVVYQAPKGALRYDWRVVGGTIVSGQGTDSIRVVWSPTANAGSLFVETYGDCGTDTGSLVVSLGQAPSFNFYTYNPRTCIGKQETYELPVSSATTYQWRLSSGGRIIGPDNTSRVTVEWDALGIHKLMLVATNVACSDSAGFEIEVGAGNKVLLTVAGEPAPPSGVGFRLCPIGRSVRLQAPAGYRSYRWSSGDTTQIISVNAPGEFFVIMGADASGCETVSDTISVRACPRFDDSDSSFVTDLPLTGNPLGLVPLDFDNDGREDLLVQYDSLNSPQLLANQTTGGRRDPVRYGNATIASGLPADLPKAHYYVSDYDGNGGQDIFMIQGGNMRIFRNANGKNQDSQYEEVTGRLCLENPVYGDTVLSSLFFDANGDSKVDIITSGDSIRLPNIAGGKTDGKASNYIRAQYGSRNRSGGRKTEEALCGPVENFCNYLEIAEFDSSIKPITQLIDYDNDGDQDILILKYIPNQPTHEIVLYSNNGSGKYTDVTADAGLTGLRSSHLSFATIWDFNNDGQFDITIGSADGSNPTYQNINGKFAPASIRLGEGAGSYTQQTTADIDNDGDLDILWCRSGSGEKPLLLVNENNTYADKTADWGLDKQDAHHAQWTDADNDGDLDLLLYNAQGTSWFLRNNTDSLTARFLRIKLLGCDAPRDGRGSRVGIYATGNWQWQYVGYGIGSNLPTSSIIHFGVGNINIIDSVVVLWANGGSTRLANVASNQVLRISQAEECGNNPPFASFTTQRQPDGSLKFVNLSENATRFVWLFPDGTESTDREPVKTFNTGTHRVKLIATGRCGTDTTEKAVFATGIANALETSSLQLYPNPAREAVWIKGFSPSVQSVRVKVWDVLGKPVYEAILPANDCQVGLRGWAAGVYHMQVENSTLRLIVE